MTKNAEERLKAVHRKRRIVLFTVIGMLVAVILGVVLYKQLTQEKGPAKATDVSDRVSGDIVTIPLSEVSDGKFHYYSNSIDGVRVRYFIVSDRSAGIRTAFDACDVCYAADKGYAQVGSSAKCMNCGNTFTVSQLGTENQRGGGCWPGYLPHEIKGDNITIELSDLREGKYYFQ
ncbi:MAG: Fe-S-containing protein [Candidatus Thermoplasmatota archaeon]|jgi:uncharacterized membrane protein|nr:Fe-S-containing protein [Candidatus Thermoplasmatota archaeon]